MGLRRGICTPVLYLPADNCATFSTTIGNRLYNQQRVREVSRVKGMLSFTADKQTVVFNSAERAFFEIGANFDWQSLGQQKLLLAFVEHFQLKRRASGKAFFQYDVDVNAIDLESWFGNHVSQKKCAGL
jgi:hypothetical protein